MKKLLMILVILLAGSMMMSALAQQKQHRQPTPQQKERVFLAKMKIIQEELSLNEQQTEKFSVVYRKYNEDMAKIFDNCAKKVKKDRPALDMVNDHINMKIELLKLQKTYYKQFAKVLTSDQLLRLDRAEQKIQFEIMNHQKQRKGKGNRGKGNHNGNRPDRPAPSPSIDEANTL